MAKTSGSNSKPPQNGGLPENDSNYKGKVGKPSLWLRLRTLRCTKLLKKVSHAFTQSWV